MSLNQPVLVAVFDDRFEAEQAVNDLEAAGLEQDKVGFVLRGSDVSRGGMITDAVGTKDGRGAAFGAAAGAAIGGTLGAAGAMLLPGIGPVVAVGLFGAMFGGAIAGTAVGGILGAMVGLGVSQEEAEYYERMFQQGKAIVAVRANGHAEDAMRIIRLHGGYNMQLRAESPVPTEGILHKP